MEEQQSEMSSALERLIFLSDGVFAIAITLLVLDVTPEIVPHLSAHELWLSLRGPVVTYTVSFAIVSIYWMTHQRIFHYIKRSDNMLVWLNIFFLLCIAFLPVPTKVLGIYGDTQTGVIFYIASVTITGLFIILLWWYATTNHRLVDERLDAALIQHHMQRAFIGPLIFVLSIGLSFIHPYLAELSWVMIGVAIFVHELYYRRRIRRSQKKEAAS